MAKIIEDGQHNLEADMEVTSTKISSKYSQILMEDKIW